jgi:hypothetical protein
VTLLAPLAEGPPVLTRAEQSPWATVVHVDGLAPHGARDTIALTEDGAEWERTSVAGERLDGAWVTA